MIQFDETPTLYYIFCYGLAWIILVLAIWPTKFTQNQTWTTLIRRDSLFLTAAFLALFLMRLPTIAYNLELDPDESQIISQALTLRHNPVYYEYVDGTTGGPLSSYLLIIPSFFGLPFDYITARLVGYLLIALSLVFLFYAARTAFDQKAARMSLIPFVLVLGLSNTYGLFFYSSELLSIATLSGLYYVFIRQLTKPKKTIVHFFLIGFLCGTVPFEKPQGTVLAALVGFGFFIQILIDKELTSSEKWRYLFALGGGAICFPILFVGWLALEGFFDDFVNFFIIDNAGYTNAEGMTFLLKLSQFRFFWMRSEGFAWLMILLAGVFIVWLFFHARRYIAATRLTGVPIFLFCLLLAATYTVIISGYFFLHYLHYMLGPLMLVLAFFFSAMQTGSLALRVSMSLLLIAFLGAFSVNFFIDVRRHRPLNPFASNHQGGWVMPQNNVTRAIAQYGHQGERLAVWGWHCDYYVLLQMTQAVAESHTIRSIGHTTIREVFHKRYVENMQRSLPPVFADAVGKSGFTLSDRKKDGYEINKVLKQIIAANYTYVGQPDDVRIFVRNDRLRSLTSH